MKKYIVDISFEVESDETEGEIANRIIEEHPTCREIVIKEGNRDSYFYPRLKATEKS